MPWIDNVAYAKVLDENATLKEQVSSLIAARESLVVLNASLAEKNEILAAKLRQHIYELSPEGSDGAFEAWAHELQADSACVYLNENDRDEEVQGRGRALAEEWAAIKKKASRQDPDLYR